MTNLTYTPASGMKSVSEEVAQAIIDLTRVMDKHVLVLEHSEQTVAMLLDQLLKAQADNADLSAKLHEAEQFVPKLREAEEARDFATERCKKAVDKCNSTKLEIRNYLLKHHTLCHSSTPPPPASTRTTNPLCDHSIVLKKEASRIRTSKDDNKSVEGVSDPSAK